MSHAHIALVQSLYEAFGRGDTATILNAASPDVVWESVGSAQDFPTLGQRAGRGGVESFFASVTEHLTFHEFSPREFYVSGDKVFVLGRYAMTVKKTGRPIASEWCHVFTIRDGVVTEFREFADTAQAAAAYRA